MLSIEKIFGLDILSNGVDGKFVKATSRVDLDGLIVGTPFVISQATLDKYKEFTAEGNPFNIKGLNPCPANRYCSIKYITTIRDSQLTISSKPTFLDTHQLVTIEKLAEIDPIVNETLNGGSATVFVKDKALIKELMYDFIPALCSKYKYYGTIMSTGIDGHSDETPALMIQMFHPSHCCAIYYPDQISGLIFSLSAVAVEKAKVNKVMMPSTTLSLFATDHKANILTLDGCNILSANQFNEGSLTYLEHLLLAENKPLKKKEVPNGYQWDMPGSKSTDDPVTSRIGKLLIQINNGIPEELPKASKQAIRMTGLRNAGIDVDSLSAATKKALRRACNMLDSKPRGGNAEAAAMIARKRDQYQEMYKSGGTLSGRSPSKMAPHHAKSAVGLESAVGRLRRQTAEAAEAGVDANVEGSSAVERPTEFVRTYGGEVVVDAPDPHTSIASKGLDSVGAYAATFWDESTDTDDSKVVAEEVVAEPEEETFIDFVETLSPPAEKTKKKTLRPRIRKKKRRK